MLVNIFVLDEDPKKAAEYHCDKHVIKMILETAQMLSTSVLFYQKDTLGLYNPTHKNHPCSIWARRSRQNFVWLASLGLHLGNEHKIRYSPKKPHASLKVIRRAISLKDSIPQGEMTLFAQAMPEKYQGDHVVKSYRNFYRNEKKSFATWKQPRKKPDWM
jgi:hypothetical protein